MFGVAVQLDARREARVSRLQAARTDDSRLKRQRALETCAALLANGIQVTFTRVARESRVSTWLVYNAPEVKAAVRAAIDQQSKNGLTGTPERVAQPASVASLRTDLALTREDNKRLRDQVNNLNRRLEQQLGLEIEGASTAELMDRIRELEDVTAKQSRQLAARDTSDADSALRLQELERELESKNELIRSMMFARNTSQNR